MVSLPPDPQIRSCTHNDVLQGDVVVRVLQVPLVIDEPVVASRIAVDVAVRSGSESGRRLPAR